MKPELLFTRLRSRRKFLVIVLGFYFAGLLVGYIRLPLAAVKSLSDYEILTAAPAITWGEPAGRVSPLQRWWLNWSFVESPVPVVPILFVDVQWNSLVCARVRSGHFIGSTGAEEKDCVYVCAFGVWIPVYTHSHVMA